GADVPLPGGPARRDRRPRRRDGHDRVLGSGALAPHAVRWIVKRVDARVLLFALGAAVVPGCYCSHELHDDAGTDDDAGSLDASSPRDWGPLPDGAPSCVFHCGDARRVATQVIVPAEGPGAFDLSVDLMDVIATDGAVWLLVRQTAPMTVHEGDDIYALHR